MVPSPQPPHPLITSHHKVAIQMDFRTVIHTSAAPAVAAPGAVSITAVAIIVVAVTTVTVSTALATTALATTVHRHYRRLGRCSTCADELSCNV